MSLPGPSHSLPPSTSAASPFLLVEPAQEDFSWSADSSPCKPVVDDDDAERQSSTKVDTASAATLGDDHLPPRPEVQDEILGARPIGRRSTSSLSSAASGSRAGEKHAQVGVDLPTIDQQDAAPDRHQAIYLPDEDVQLQLSFYRRSILRLVVWYALCFLTAGIWYIADSWANNKWWIRWNCTPISLRHLDSRRHVLVRIKSKHGDVDILPLRRIGFAHPVDAGEVFPSSLPVPFESASDAATREFTLAAQDHGLTPDASSAATLTHVDVLEYRASTFLLHPSTGNFRQLSSWRDPCWTTTETAMRGLQSDVLASRKTLFGLNQIFVPGKSVWAVMFEEVLHPLYVFQVYSIILWANDEYVPYAIVIGVISIIGIGATTITTKHAINRLQRMSRFSCNVEVYRASHGEKAGGAWSRMNSEELVPGDVVDICATNGGDDDSALLSVLPCDLVLLEGDCIVNESMLTGESVPVVKAPIPNSKMETILAAGGDLGKIDKHLIYSGTRIVRARPPSREDRAQATAGDGSAEVRRARALVVRTAFSTAKGSLVRQMLFPRPISFKFYRDGFIFIGFLFAMALIGMVSTCIYFSIIGVESEEIALRALDVLTIACPPALPATLSICITFAISRLRRGQIFCLSPQRINVAGKVNMLVFDKTGTLTEEGLDVLGVRTVAAGGHFSELTQTAQDLPGETSLSLDEAMATAHDLNLLDGKALGEPLEVKMLEWTGRQLEDDADRAPVQLKREGASDSAPGEPSQRPRNADGQLARVPVILPLAGSSHKRLAVIRTFAFSPELRRMSVIVKREGEGEVGAQIYCKGAPEAIFGLCETDSLPTDYDAVLDHYTRAGYRVLAVAGRVVEGMSWAGAQTLPRSAAESRMRFLGLIVFENKLKPGTAPAIATLRDDARLPIKVCTGDSVLTAVSVAKECGILDTAARVYAPRLCWTNTASAGKKGDAGAETVKASLAHVEWVDLDDEDRKLDSYTLDPLDGTAKLGDVELAVSGEILRTLVDGCAKETLERMLVQAKVFARCSPEQKQDLVERLQNLGYTVGFTGDGANDCGALKAADVGLSLSEAEASVAAPFTSRKEDISCVQQLLREGRSTLTVSFAMFKWMACYSLCEYMTVLLLYGQATSLDNAEYLFIDVFMVLPIAIGMANSLPSKKLHCKAPAARLASIRPIISTMGQVVLIFVAQTVVYVVLHRQSWYVPPELDPNNLQLNDMDNTALFRASVFGYVIAGIAYSAGPPHRQHLYLNWILFPALFILGVFCFYFLFLTSGPFFTLFGFVDTPSSFSWIIFGVVVAQFVVAMLFEAYGVQLVATYVAEPLKRLVTRRKTGPREKDYRRILRAIEHGR
ncbi:uncharacterized protein PFL1_00988 [Pseudozyma flocculosa PF-1]|uniref:Cation-transporting ATPase n=1 Tax=Pseudozyma flocculosa TaxID=84751 RepID=A0A5C3F988_9BASI|nr:uncharacterized protein PFL1_00988 [Pseudozyma flocculosa PF-1]EPQ31655.1 hypothetical protein PFL1_00988 [Pseudozyma flocculosa PF-1]SPO40770.1 related to YPK9 - vacuolar protein with a possible role in sequestering heavy metals [Pseudozyma flocculosa]